MRRISRKYLRLSLLEETTAWPSIGCAGRDANRNRSSDTSERRPRDAPRWKINQQIRFVTDMHPSQRRKYCPVCFLVFFMSVGLRLSYRREAGGYIRSPVLLPFLVWAKVVFACSFSPLNEEVDYFNIFPTSSTFSKDCYLWRVLRCYKTKRVLWSSVCEIVHEIMLTVFFTMELLVSTKQLCFWLSDKGVKVKLSPNLF